MSHNSIHDFFSGFYDAGKKKIESAMASTPSTYPATGPGSPGGLAFEALYQYGRGKLDAARERLVDSFRASSEGQKLEAIATRKKAGELAPFIIAGIGVIFLIGFVSRGAKK